MAPIEVKTGPMYSGKSLALLGLIERHTIAGLENDKHFLVVNHASDTRYQESSIASHKKDHNTHAIPMSDPREIYLHIVDPNTRQLRPQYKNLMAIFIDEGQFFNAQDEDGYILPRVLRLLDKLGLNVYIAGLNRDFRGEPFSPMDQVMAIADKVDLYHAVCNYDGCYNMRATRTQRLVNGEPANYHDPIIMVGASEAYEARCPEHHFVPGHPLEDFEASLQDYHPDLDSD